MKSRSAALVGGSLTALAGWDLWQRQHSILRNYPIVGHLRFLLEAVGPELRQYSVTDNDAERPFSRDQRRRSEFAYGRSDGVQQSQAGDNGGDYPARDGQSA